MLEELFQKWSALASLSVCLRSESLNDSHRQRRSEESFRFFRHAATNPIFKNYFNFIFGF